MSTTYSYFDQFNNYEIDFTKYLSRFNIEFSNKQPIVTTLKNLFDRVKVIDDFKLRTTLFSKYEVPDSELISNTAYKLYGSTDYWWVIAIFNDIKNPFFDWVLTAEQLNALATKLSVNEKKYTKDTYYDLLFSSNEEKRNIYTPTRTALPNIMFELAQNFANKSEFNLSV